MLLDPESRPEYGALDFFVENGFGTVDDSFLRAMVSPSRLTAGRGLISVLPVTGLTTQRSPHNMLAKLARGYLDKPYADGSATFLDQTRELVRRLTTSAGYDAVFVDARAGLNESSAASILGLGGVVLLFGVDTPQTFQGYRYLFAHLNRFTTEKGNVRWRERLQMIHAKAARNTELQKRYRDRAFDLFSEWIYDEAEFYDIDAFNFDLDDEAAPHFAWPILHDTTFLEFDPLADPAQLGDKTTSQTFDPFVRRLAAQIGLQFEADGRSTF